MSSPIDCSSPNAFPDASLTSSSTLLDGQSSDTLDNDPIVPYDNDLTVPDALSDGQSSDTLDNDHIVPYDNDPIVPDALSDGQSSDTLDNDPIVPGHNNIASLGDDSPGGRVVAQRDRALPRGVTFMLCGLLALLVAFLSALYAPGNNTMAPGCRAPVYSWATASEPEPIDSYVTLNITKELMGFADIYEPFLGGKGDLLRLTTLPNRDPINTAHEFFEKIGYLTTFICDSIKQSHADAIDKSLLGRLGRRHEHVTEELCRPIVDLVGLTSDTYLDIANALAGPHPESLWMHQVAAQLSIMAEQILLVPGAADIIHMGGPGTVVGEADYVKANNSAAGVFQAHMGPGGMLPRLNSGFIGALWELRRKCAALREAFAALAPVANSFIAGMSVSPASIASAPVSPWSQDGVGGDPLLFQAHVVDSWLDLESALIFLDALTDAAKEATKALAMANYQLQVSHDLLGSLRASCWVQMRMALDGGDFAVHVRLAEPRSLYDAVVGVSEQLEMQAMGS